MPILPILSDEYNRVVMALCDAATHLLHAAARSAPATEPVAHAMLDGLHRANLPFCAYGAVACVLGLKSYLDRKDRKLETAQDHTLHSCASLILALFHLLG